MAADKHYRYPHIEHSLTALPSHFAALTLYFSHTTAILKLLLSLTLLSHSAAITLYTLLLSQYCPSLLLLSRSTFLTRLLSHHYSHTTDFTLLLLRCRPYAAALALLLSHHHFHTSCCCSDCCSRTTVVLTLLSHTAALTSLCSRRAALNCRPIVYFYRSHSLILISLSGPISNSLTHARAQSSLYTLTLVELLSHFLCR